MSRSIRIGTRDSALALKQATQVYQGLQQAGVDAQLVEIKSEGDLDLVTPLYETGIQGIFTRSLDMALLADQIDIAVHSYKDVPTLLAEGLEVAAVLKRVNPVDMLVCRNRESFDHIESGKESVIATSSIRRRAQWLYRYRNSRIENIRGNVPTRLEKLKNSSWHGVIFAAAGLERLGLLENTDTFQQPLHWMLPAPAQGAIVIICRKGDKAAKEACQGMNDLPTMICTQVERDFLRNLLGGCSTPISALARIEGDELLFTGNITSPDGRESITVDMREELGNHLKIAEKASRKILSGRSIKELLS